ncbi:unnamed protein product, partial [Ectocarpus fasciculatus]
GSRYHYECFRCAGCDQAIDGAFSTVSGDYYHPACYETLYVPKCIVCDASLSGQEFMRHVYFRDEGGYCKHHEGHVKSCFSCNRKEPRSDPFVELPDGRHSCFDCVSSAIFESADAKAIYLETVEFMRTGLGLEIPPGMTDVPVLAVDLACLNDQQNVNAFGRHDCGTVCRGLTLSTSRTTIRYFNPGALLWVPRGSDKNSGNNTRGIPATHTTKNVTAVLVLFGLPSHLMASILAHEAMHVWCKLHNSLSRHELPSLVEEGLCQLVSFHYLEHVDAKCRVADEKRAKAAWEYKMIKYCKFAIETDTTPVYGEGFRQASRICAAIGLSELINYIGEENSFPCV